MAHKNAELLRWIQRAGIMTGKEAPAVDCVKYISETEVFWVAASRVLEGETTLRIPVAAVKLYDTGNSGSDPETELALMKLRNDSLGLGLIVHDPTPRLPFFYYDAILDLANGTSFSTSILMRSVF